MKAAFPREPVVPLALALIATLEDDLAARRQHREELVRLVDPVQMRSLDGALRMVELGVRINQSQTGDIKNLMVLVQAARNDPRGLLPANFGGLLAPVKLLFRPEGVSEAVGIGLPLLRRPNKLYQDITESDWHLTRGKLAEAEKILVRAEREGFESLLYFLLGRLHLLRANKALEHKDPIRRLKEFELAYDFLVRGVDAPTLDPGSSSRRAAWGCLLFEVRWGQQAREIRARAGCAAATMGHPLLALTPLIAGQPDTDRLPRPADDRILLRLLEPARRPDRDRAEVIPMMIDGMNPDEARCLLHRWRRDEPSNVAPYQFQARLELRLGNPRSALEWAQRGLTVRPGDATSRQLERQAREALAPAASPPSTSPRPGG